MSITSDRIRENDFIHALADDAADDIEQLEACNAELEKEVEALTNERDLNVRQCDANTQLISQLRQQLTAIQEALSDNFSESKDWLFDSDPICRINWLKSFHRQHRNDIDELCQQLAIKESENN